MEASPLELVSYTPLPVCASYLSLLPPSASPPPSLSLARSLGLSKTVDSEPKSLPSHTIPVRSNFSLPRYCKEPYLKVSGGGVYTYKDCKERLGGRGFRQHMLGQCYKVNEGTAAVTPNGVDPKKKGYCYQLPLSFSQRP